MAKRRMISASLVTSERRARLFSIVPDLAEFCQVLHVDIITHSDDFGRMAGEPFTVKMTLAPASPRSIEDVARALLALHEAGHINWYVVDGRRFIQVEQFDKHQTGLHKRTQSDIPEPPGRSEKFPEHPWDAVVPPEILPELKRTEAELKERTAASPRRSFQMTDRQRSDAALRPAEDGNFAVIEKMAFDLAEQGWWEVNGQRFTIASETELVMALKDECGRLGIDYGRHPDVDFDVVHRAAASEWFKRTRPIPRFSSPKGERFAERHRQAMTN